MLTKFKKIHVSEFVKTWDGSAVSVNDLIGLPFVKIRGKPLIVNRNYNVWCPKCECSLFLFIDCNVQFPIECPLCGYIFCDVIGND